MNSLIQQHKADLDRLCRQFSVRRLELFGSAAVGTFDLNRSDLDFLVQFDELPPMRYADVYFNLKEALETLFGRPVDLITEANLGNPYFRQRVLAERQQVYAR